MLKNISLAKYLIFFLPYVFIAGCTYLDALDENIPLPGCKDGNCKNGYGREIEKISGLVFLNTSTAIYQEYAGSFQKKKREGSGTLREFSIEFDAAASGWDWYSGSCVYGCVYYQRETSLFVGNFYNNQKQGYGKIRINNTKIYNQSQEPFPFNESQETPHYTVIEGEWKDDILITTISTNQGLTEEQSRKILYN